MNLTGIMHKRWKWAAALLVVLAVSVGAFVMLGASQGSAAVDGRPVFTAQRGPLTISVSVSGTISALDQEVITNEVEGRTTILYIIPEGTHVEEGELLVELDSAELRDQLVDQEIRTQNAQASFINARETLLVVKNQAQSDVDQAELDYLFAKEDRVKFIEGDFPLQIKEAEAKVTVARGQLKQAEETLEGSRKLAERNFITQMELEADEQDAIRASLDLQMAEEQKKLLEEYEYKRQLAQLESDESQARMALERAQAKAKADVAQAEADLIAKDLEFQREQAKLEKLKEQLEKTKLYAPRAGLVVYATTGRGGWRGNEEPLEEGREVRQREELIYLPTTNAYKAQVKVHESSLSKVGPGMPVSLVVDALPGRRFSGKITFISPMPDAQSVWMNPDLKVYNTDIILEGDTEGLRTGMSCRGEILVKKFVDAVYVPVQCVVREAGVPTVYVVEGNKVERRAVEIGLDNNRMVKIESGLEPGEDVLLNPPLGADEIAGLEPEDGGEAPEAESTEVPAAGGTAEGGALAPAPAAAAEGGAAEDDASGEERRGPGGEGGGPSAEMRERFMNASPEERQRMMEERMKSMTPEEQQRMRERMQRFQAGQGGGEGGGGSRGQ